MVNECILTRGRQAKTFFRADQMNFEISRSAPLPTNLRQNHPNYGQRVKISKKKSSKIAKEKKITNEFPMAILFSKTTTSIALHEKSKIEIQR